MEVQCCVQISKEFHNKKSILKLFLIISDSIEAVHDIWFVGDAFLRETFNRFQEMINLAKLNTKNWQPYLLEYYNIKSFYAPAKIWQENDSATSRILNKLIDALNENNRLPKFICILPDRDIINNIKAKKKSSTKNLSNLINWLMRQCEIEIRRKRLQITAKKPGAVTENYPTLIYQQMIHRNASYPEGSNIASICELTQKFNSILNKAAARTESKIIRIQSCHFLGDFDRYGNLTSAGKSTMWHEFDDLMERFEDPKDKRINLKPRGVTSQKY